jgi:ubiquinone/menaquinone biosynthesis C-methylase UbiE
MSGHDESVLQQFSPQARAYLESAVHAAGPDLEHARRLLEGSDSPRGRAVDIGCGAGHLSFALCTQVAHVIALDASAEMLEVVRKQASVRNLSQVETRQASAGALPFDDAAFDIVGTRYSAHHWLDIEKAIGEMRRVLRPGGHALLIDTLGDASPLVDTHLQAIELLRDRSHVRNATQTQWRAMLAAHRFSVLEFASWPTRLEFDSWIRRMRTSAPRVEAIHTLMREAPREVCHALAIEADGSFTIRTGLFWVRREGS